MDHLVKNSPVFWPPCTPPLLPLGHIWDVTLQYCSCYNGAHRYEQFLQVGWLPGFDLAWFSCLSSECLLCLWSSWWIYIFIYIFKKNLFTSLSFSKLSRWYWALFWLTNHRPSVLWHCWLGHVTRKIIPEMIYSVSSGTLSTTSQYLNMSTPFIIIIIMRNFLKWPK